MRIPISLMLAATLACAGAAHAATAVEPLVARATAGDADARYQLARYWSGATGERLDRHQALAYLRQAADSGHAGAQVELAFLYFNGSEQVAKDQAASLRWFRQAAGQGSVVAQCMLGDFHAKGLGGLKPDPVQAVRWYGKTATTSDRCAPKSQYALYLSHESGRGVRKDLAVATAWLRKAAEAGNPQAQATLSKNYATGHGVPRDGDLAQFWRLKSRAGVSPHDDHFFGDGDAPGHAHRH